MMCVRRVTRSRQPAWACAWCLNPHSGRAWGVEPYPGLPVMYANGVTDLTLREFDYQRPTPLPAGWNHNALCLENTDK